MLKQKSFYIKDIETRKNLKSKEKIELKFSNENFFLSKFGPKTKNCRFKLKFGTYNHPKNI